MQIKPTVYIKGIDDFEKNINKVISSTTRHIPPVLNTAGQKVRKRLKANTPVGKKQINEAKKMKNATYTKVTPETSSYPATAFVGYRPRKAPHAHLVIGGHGGPHPAPAYNIVQKTWDEMRDEVKTDIEKGITKAVEGAF
jgi:HK97 gp10 family phage protein